MSRARFKKVINHEKFYRLLFSKGSVHCSVIVEDSPGQWRRLYGTINKERSHLYVHDINSDYLQGGKFYRYKLTEDVIGGLQVEGYPVYFRILFETF